MFRTHQVQRKGELKVSSLGEVQRTQRNPGSGALPEADGSGRKTSLRAVDEYDGIIRYAAGSDTAMTRKTSASRIRRRESMPIEGGTMKFPDTFNAEWNRR